MSTFKYRWEGSNGERTFEPVVCCHYHRKGRIHRFDRGSFSSGRDKSRWVPMLSPKGGIARKSVFHTFCFLFDLEGKNNFSDLRIRTKEAEFPWVENILNSHFFHWSFAFFFHFLTKPKQTSHQRNHVDRVYMHMKRCSN